MPDPRAGLKECELCDSADFRPGAVCQAPVAPAKEGCSCHEKEGPAPDPQIEAIVRAVTEQILKQLKS
jgi:L-fuculose-phosphate aldolase